MYVPCSNSALPSSGISITPKAWNDLPLFTTLKTILSPTLAWISGLFPSSPGRALNASVLKSDDSTNASDTEISFPVAATGALTSYTGPFPAVGGADIQ